MCKLSTSFLLISVLSLILVQKCNGVMNLRLRDNIVVSPLTPFDDKGNLKPAVVPELAQYYTDNNLKVIYVPSYYGGAPSIPLPDRKRLIKAWEEQSKRLGFDLICEVGALPYVDTLEMARYCSELNVTALSTFPEITYQATTMSEALEDLQRICDAAGNKLPLLYHELTVVNQNIETDEVFVGAMGGCVSCFIGVITTVNTFLGIKAAVDSIEGYQFWGYGIQAVAASLKVGMNASETVNFFPELNQKIKDAVDNCQLKLSEDLQQELNRRMYAITNVDGGAVDVTKRSYFEQEKEAFELLTGIDVGYRYPLEMPNSTVIDEIRSNLQGLGVCLYSSDKNN